MKTVRVLGAGCSKYRVVEQRIPALKPGRGLDFGLAKITHLSEIISHGTKVTPGPAINGELRSVGTVPKDSQVSQWLKDQSNESQ